MSNSKESEDVLSLLDSLGDSVPPTAVPPTGEEPASAENEKELLGFLDDLAKQPSRSQTPKPSGGARVSREPAQNIHGTAKKSPEKIVEKSAAGPPVESPPVTANPPAEVAGGVGWFGGLWSMGTAAMKTAEQKVKELQQTDEAKAWEERVLGNVSALGKLGNDLRARTLPSLSSTISTVLNTIAPPIEKHEVLKVGIYHDMVGFPNIDKVVYDVFEKVMGQVEGGSLIVQKGREGKRRGSDSRNQRRDLNICEGIEEAHKLAKANVAEPIRSPSEEAVDPSVPVHISYIHLAIQPTIYNVSPPTTPPPPPTKRPSTPVAISPPERNFAYAIYLVDPVHSLEFSTISQGFPAEWLRWQDDQEEVADAVGEWTEDGLRLAVACVAQSYVAKRMGIGNGRRREEKGKDRE